MIEKEGSPQDMAMAFRVERLVSGEECVVLRVSGRIHAEHVDMLRELLGLEQVRVVVDLREVTLVDREAVSFLALSEAQGVELKNCAAYLREWVDRERRHTDTARANPKAGGGADIRDL
jgi:hypothetical protein